MKRFALTLTRMYYYINTPALYPTILAHII